MGKHKGMREFSAEELSGTALGQNGFKIITGVDFFCGGDFLEEGETATSGNTIDYFIALKVVDVDAEVEAGQTAYDALSDEHKSMHSRPVKYNLP